MACLTCDPVRAEFGVLPDLLLRCVGSALRTTAHGVSTAPIPPGGKHILSTSAQLSTGARVARCDAVSSSDSASQETGHRPEDYKRFRDLSRQVRAVQRAAILNLRNENEINDEVMHKFEHELDSVEARFEASHDS